MASQSSPESLSSCWFGAGAAVSGSSAGRGLTGAILVVAPTVRPLPLATLRGTNESITSVQSVDSVVACSRVMFLAPRGMDETV